MEVKRVRFETPPSPDYTPSSPSYVGPLIPEGHEKYIKEGKNYDHRCGIFTFEVESLTPERKKVVLDYIEKENAFFVVTVKEDCPGFWDVTLGFGPNGKLTQVLDPNDPNLEMKMAYEEKAFKEGEEEEEEEGKLIYPALHYPEYHVIDKEDTIITLADDLNWGDSPIELFIEVMYVWVECHIAGQDLLLVNH